MAPDWLTARPIAHRGLHDAAAARVENSLAAACAAVECRYAIECDVQLARDGEAIVFHDFTLDRLTREGGPVAARSAGDLGRIGYRAGTDTIASLPDLLARVAGRVPIMCEVKSRFDGDLRLADRVAALARTYAGPFAVKSFDPGVIAHLRRDPPCPLGMVAEASYDHPEWDDLSPVTKRELAHFLHYGETRPDFLSYRVGDLPHAVPLLLRRGLGLPVVTWTVRGQDQADAARPWTDAIVFEGFRP